MSSVDPFVKETFNAYSFSSDDANQTRLLAIRLAEKINIQDSLITISIVGGVADGKSTMAKALARHILKEADYELRSKLIGRSEPAWRIQGNFNDKVMVRHLDMAAIDMFEDPIMPSLQPRTLDIIEHAKHLQQE
jgi:tRNA A37 threonylcarbamoyladenosine biosynthesis protein TsaE